MKRDLEALRAKPFDLVVIGGGILGAACAHRAAAFGYRVAVLEKGDFACATSSQSSKLIHGGLRYLAQAHLGLVRESLAERAALLAEAYALVQPLRFFLPVYPLSAWPLWQARLGLLAYDFLSHPHSSELGSSCSVSRAEFLKRVPGMRHEGLAGVLSYWDATTDDARLCIETLKRAWALSAVVANRMSVCGFQKAQGRIVGVEVKDMSSGALFSVPCRAVVNAAGPWVDSLRRLDEPQARPVLRLTKGSHLVARRFGPPEALLLTAPQDRRVFFVLPFGEDHTLVGTTDTDHQDPDAGVHATREDVEYLRAAVRFYFGPRALGDREVCCTFAGLRSLVARDGSPSSLSRGEAFVMSASGMLSLVGGKFTTHRAIAKRALERLVASGNLAKSDAKSISLALCDRSAHETLKQTAEAFFEERQVTPASVWAEAWASRYGLSVARLLALSREFPAELAPLCPHQPYLAVEIRYAVREEMAVSLEDVLRRRTRVALTSCRGQDAAERVAAILASEHGWDESRRASELALYRSYLASGALENCLPSR